MVYLAKLALMVGFKAIVTPNKLILKQKYENQNYKMTMQGPLVMKDSMVFYYPSWEENRGKNIIWKAYRGHKNIGTRIIIE